MKKEEEQLKLPVERKISHDYLSYYGFDRAEVEKRKNAKFVGEFCLKNPQGNWNESPVEVYYDANSNFPCPYFGLFVQNKVIYITGAESTVGIPIAGVVAKDGEIIYSRYRHDYRVSRDGSVFIDGGRDYTRSSMGCEFVTLMIKDGALQEV